MLPMIRAGGLNQRRVETKRRSSHGWRSAVVWLGWLAWEKRGSGKMEREKKKRGENKTVGESIFQLFPPLQKLPFLPSSPPEALTAIEERRAGLAGDEARRAGAVS